MRHNGGSEAGVKVVGGGMDTLFSKANDTLADTSGLRVLKMSPLGTTTKQRTEPAYDENSEDLF